MADKPTDQRVTCSRHHWLFSVTTEGIAIKCRAGECRTVYTVPWDEIEEKRLQVTREQMDGNGILAVKPMLQ